MIELGLSDRQKLDQIQHLESEITAMKRDITVKEKKIIELQESMK